MHQDVLGADGDSELDGQTLAAIERCVAAPRVFLYDASAEAMRERLTATAMRHQVVSDQAVAGVGSASHFDRESWDNPLPGSAHPVAELARHVARSLVFIGVPVLPTLHSRAHLAGGRGGAFLSASWSDADHDGEVPAGVLLDWDLNEAASITGMFPACDVHAVAIADDIVRAIARSLRRLGFQVERVRRDGEWQWMVLAGPSG